MNIKTSHSRNKNKKPLTKYEKEMMLNLNIIKWVAVLIVMVNFLLPIFQKGIGVNSIFQWIIVAVHIKTLGNAVGIFEQKVPILSIGFLRIFEIGIHSIFKFNPINWSFFLIILVIDFIYLFLLFIDKQSYEYIVEDYSESNW